MSRVPFIPQLEAAECGAACLAMVLAAHGHQAPLAEVRERCGVTRDGVTARAIAVAAGSYGLEVRPLRSEASALRTLSGLAILHWDLSHFVVLERATRSGARIVDPSLGPRLVSADDLDASFSGVVLELRPASGFVRRRAPRSFARWRPLLAGVALPLAKIAVGTLLIAIANMLVPAATPLVFDEIAAAGQARWLPFAGAMLVGAVALRVVVGYARDRLVAELRAGLAARLLSAFGRQLCSLPMAFFTRRTTGDLLSRVAANMALREVTTRSVMAVLDSGMVVACGGLLCAFDTRLGALVVGLSVVRVVAASLGRRHVAAMLAGELTAGAREEEAAVEAFANPEVIKACGAEAHVLARFARGTTTRLNKSLERRSLERRNAAVGTVIEGATQACVLWYGGLAVLDDRMTLGVLSTFLAAQALLAGPLLSLVEAVRDLPQVRQHLARLDDIFDAAPEARGTVRLPQVRGAVSFEEVTYRQSALAAPVLRGVSFFVAPGEELAIVGRNGGGKSTILRLLLGLADPSEGTIRVDGHDLRDLDRAAFRLHVGVVSQGDFFFDLSVRENLTLGLGRHVPDAHLHAALRAACVDDVVAELPGGLDARLGTGAPRLSGGQRQRLAIARALVRAPSVLVLDEATSSLDRALECRVMANLRALGCTRIVVAHRPETIRGADHVIVLDAGEVVQRGRDPALVAASVGLDCWTGEV